MDIQVGKQGGEVTAYAVAKVTTEPHLLPTLPFLCACPSLYRDQPALVRSRLYKESNMDTGSTHVPPFCWRWDWAAEGQHSSAVQTLLCARDTTNGQRKMAGIEMKMPPPFFFIKLIIGLDSNLIARARTKGKLILDLNTENLNGA